MAIQEHQSVEAATPRHCLAYCSHEKPVESGWSLLKLDRFGRLIRPVAEPTATAVRDFLAAATLVGDLLPFTARSSGRKALHSLSRGKPCWMQNIC